MDKETAVELERVKAKADADGKRIEALEKDIESWNALIRKTILKTISWLLAVGAAGVMFGWHLPEDVRKSLAKWMSE